MVSYGPSRNCILIDLRVFRVDWKPELTYATIFAKIQLSSSNREVSGCTM